MHLPTLHVFKADSLEAKTTLDVVLGGLFVLAKTVEIVCNSAGYVRILFTSATVFQRRLWVTILQMMLPSIYIFVLE